jgi:hypothetical protein
VGHGDARTVGTAQTAAPTTRTAKDAR